MRCNKWIRVASYDTTRIHLDFNQDTKNIQASQLSK
jgi:hypothetical protein